MAPSRSLLVFTTIILLFSTFATAWPWPRFLPELDSLIVRRQNGGSSTTGTGSGPAPTTRPANTPSGSNTVSGSNSGTAKNTGSGTGSATGSGSATAKTDTASGSATPTETDKTVYDPRLPVGGVTMMTPAASSGAQYYKIGQQITFGWNYTNLLATPTAVNIFATCTLNSALYTIGMNQTIGTSGVATWDTNGYETASAPLVQQTYTLIIYDAESSVSAVPQAGYLAPFKGLTFGMYAVQSPFPSDSLGGAVKCATCSGAMSNMKTAIGFMFAMSAITVLSFTWFAGGAGVIW